MSELGSGIRGSEAVGGVTTGANVGAGVGLIFRDKTGNFINFKSLVAGANITINNNADSVEIVAVSGEVFTWSADHDANVFSLLNAFSVRQSGVDPAKAGFIRIRNGQSINWRNNVPANQDLILSVNSSNELVITGGFSRFNCSVEIIRVPDIEEVNLPILANNGFIRMTNASAGITFSDFDGLGGTFGIRANTANELIAQAKMLMTTIATKAGLNVGALAGDPSALVDGDYWYNSSTNKQRTRQNGVSEDVVGGAGGLSVADIAARESTSQNTTTTLTPAVGEQFVFNQFGESLPAIINTVEWSANAGANFFDPSARIVNLSQMGTTTGTVLDSPIDTHLNNGSRLRWTNPATVGTYIIARIGTIFS